MHVCILCMYVCNSMYVCMHACMHVCMYVYISNRVQELEQYSRRNAVVLSGVKESPGENTDAEGGKVT